MTADTQHMAIEGPEATKILGILTTGFALPSYYVLEPRIEESMPPFLGGRLGGIECAKSEGITTWTLGPTFVDANSQSDQPKLLRDIAGSSIDSGTGFGVLSIVLRCSQSTPESRQLLPKRIEVVGRPFPKLSNGPLHTLEPKSWRFQPLVLGWSMRRVAGW